MRIYIVGSGGLGGYLGGLLARAGEDVTFIARGEHYRAMKEEGLKVKSVPGDFEVKPAQVINRISDMTHPDLIIFAVKTYDTEKTAKELSTVVNKETMIISIQNGIDNDREIKKHILNGVVYPGVAYVAVEKTKAGFIEQTGGPRKFIFGDRKDPENRRLKEVEKLMRRAGVDAMVSADITGDLWKKFMFIVAFSGMTAVCRSPIGKVLGEPVTRGLYERCLEEAICVAKSLNISVEDKAFENIMSTTCNFHPDSKSSLLVDIENQRRTEIETLNGKVVRLAKENEIDVPVNELIYGAVKLSSRV